MTASSPGSRAPRSLAGDLPGWASGLVTGALAAAVSLLVVIAPTLASLATAPVDGTDTDWGAGIAVAMRIWLLGMGVPAATSLGTYSLVPLGLTLLILGILVATAQRFLLRSWDAVGLAVAAFATLAGFVASFAWRDADDASDLVVRAVVGALLLGVPGVFAGRVRAYGLRIDVVDLIPPTVRAGIRASLSSLSLVVVLAAAAGAVSAFKGAGTMAATVTSLDAGAVGSGVLALAQLAYVPTLVVWMMAWVAGVGFSVGAGTVYSPGTVESGALPELPLLGALPQGSGGLLVWTPLALVAVGIAVRLVLRRRIVTWREELVVMGVSGVVTLLVAAATMRLATGAAGPGRLAEVGPSVWAAAAAIAGLTLAGHALVGGVFAGLAAWKGRGAGADETADEPQPAVGSSTP
ncbi:cell division protein PerM [Demequina salsinemoris]|uniref:cell division protein PerM n=1 Tax=Demequina salsinemoris TaxID=577470 RepID=UPI000780408C|nr:DUF6350 family protein [Demequina salsinemoris]